jgi:hypothetical protein
MRWPRSPEDGGVFLAGMCWALLLFWVVVYAVTYGLRGG